MSATPPTTPEINQPVESVLPGSGHAEPRQIATNTISMKWSALHDAAGVVAVLAGLTHEPMGPEMRGFPAMMRDTGGWRRNLAEQGIADLSAVMEPGLTALLAVHASNANTGPAALALWQEFQGARAALLTLTPPPT